MESRCCGACGTNENLDESFAAGFGGRGNIYNMNSRDNIQAPYIPDDLK